MKPSIIFQMDNGNKLRYEFDSTEERNVAFKEVKTLLTDNTSGWIELLRGNEILINISHIMTLTSSDGGDSL